MRERKRNTTAFRALCIKIRMSGQDAIFGCVSNKVVNSGGPIKPKRSKETNGTISLKIN